MARKVFLKNTDLVEYFKTWTEDQWLDSKFIEDQLINQIGMRLNWKGLKIKEPIFEIGGLQIKQYPEEFAKYMTWLYRLCKETQINTYLCIGPERGGEFYTIDALFRSLNPDFQKSVAIDVTLQMIRNRYNEYKEQHNIEFVNANSSKITRNDIPLDKIDYCFIDGDHSYDGVKSDYELIVPHASYIGFHDINCPMFGVKDFWHELKDSKKHEWWEFITEDERYKMPINIGVIKVK
jgi:hypothetical protein